MNFTKEISYINGNTKVTLLEDGTKIREYENTPLVIHPESIDVKITDYCDMGCSYCHESSTTKGKQGNLITLMDVIKDLPAGVELAIGGGNPLSHTELLWFLYRLKEKGLIANITINQGHLGSYQSLIQFLIKEELIHGVGISITNNNFKYIKPLLQLSNNIVYHIICGVNQPSILDTLYNLNLSQNRDTKILVLGYKQFGFGINYFSQEVEDNIQIWKRKLRYYTNKLILSFDNLSIEQLEIKKWFTKEGWQQFYMGDDFQFTMYIDAVKQEYAPTSRSLQIERESFNDTTLLKYFLKNK